MRFWRKSLPVLAALAAVSSSCNDWPLQSTAGFRVLSVTLVTDGLREPVYVTAPPGDPRLFVVERDGRVLVMQRDGSQSKTFLDTRSLVSTFGSERGTLGLAFHPQYAQNGRFFVSYTGLDGGIHLDRYQVSPTNPDAANSASRKELLNIAAPGTSHYGGMIAFTPDGNLMMSVGEGAAFAEPGGESQNPRSLLGKILRLDVDRGDTYAIPSGNPYEFGGDGAPEVWALGLRNPWRFSIDPTTHQLFLADVGDNAYEEVNIVPVDEGGLNYGWNYYEGPNCQYTADLCTSAVFHTPEVEYTHQPPCTSITGGIVYRGELAEHRGRYFYSDYCLGWIRSLRYEGGQITEALDWATSLPSANIVSFGEDGFRELYAVSLTGRIYRLGAEQVKQD